MHVVLKNGDLKSVHDTDEDVVRLLLHTVKVHGGIGIVDDSGDSFTLKFDDSEAFRSEREKNKTAGKPLAHGLKWTAAEVDCLAELFFDDAQVGRIADVLDRSPSGVIAQLAVMGLVSEYEAGTLTPSTTATSLRRRPEPSPYLGELIV
jgi:hypothetical protein